MHNILWVTKAASGVATETFRPSKSSAVVRGGESVVLPCRVVAPQSHMQPLSGNASFLTVTKQHLPGRITL